MKNQKPIPELPNQLEINFKENSDRKYVQQNAGISLLAKESNMLNPSKLHWISNVETNFVIYINSSTY